MTYYTGGITRYIYYFVIFQAIVTLQLTIDYTLNQSTFVYSQVWRYYNRSPVDNAVDNTTINNEKVR